MSVLPSGTVTFLFTDIEGSTCLLQELGPLTAELDILPEAGHVATAQALEAAVHDSHQEYEGGQRQEDMQAQDHQDR